jgi:hypothetical protein
VRVRGRVRMGWRKNVKRRVRGREEKRELWEKKWWKKGIEKKKCVCRERDRDIKKNQRKKTTSTLILPFIVLPDGHQFMHTVSAHLLL